MNPTVSVIIPVYNNARTISRTVDSVLAQTIDDIEVIIVDDGSTDDTRAHLKPYGKRIRYFYQSNQERSAARNNGLLQARGQYIAFLDADDYWLPLKLEKQIAVFQNNPELGLVYSQAYVIKKQDQPLYILGKKGIDSSNDPSETFCRLLVGNFIPSPTPLISRQCVRDAGFYDEKISIREDNDYWLRVARNYPILGIPEPLAFYQLSEGDFLKKLAAKNAQDAYVYVVEKYKDDHPCSQDDYYLALALSWFRAALIDFGIGDLEAGKHRLDKATECNAALFYGYDEHVTQSICDLAVQLSLSQPTAKRGEAFIHQVCEYLSESISNESQLQSALGKYYSTRFFQAQWAGDRHTTRISFLPMILNNPKWLINKGVISTTMRAFLKG